jgi:hypothetical protein
MKTMDARKLHLATFPLRLIRRHSVAAFVITLCLFPPGRVLASDGSSSRLGASQDTAGPNAGPGTTAWIRVAEGEYKVLTENGIGPFNPAVYGFSESWTLWRLPDGSFEVNGTRNYRSPSDEPHSNEFSVHLSRDFRVLGLKEFRRLRWRSDSGPLNCTSAGKDRLHIECERCDPERNVRLAHGQHFWIHVADFCIFVGEHYAFRES